MQRTVHNPLLLLMLITQERAATDGTVPSVLRNRMGIGSNTWEKGQQLCGGRTGLRSTSAPWPRSQSHQCLCCDSGGTARDVISTFSTSTKELLLLFFPHSLLAISPNCTLLETQASFFCLSLHCVKSETVSSVTATETAAERMSALCKDVYYT